MREIYKRAYPRLVTLKKERMEYFASQGISLFSLQEKGEVSQGDSSEKGEGQCGEHSPAAAIYSKDKMSLKALSGRRRSTAATATGTAPTSSEDIIRKKMRSQEDISPLDYKYED